mmetsp:Transcript_14954/g.23436  ORF Transcript_14954/g.23436 Transcript_14954/m.23436 type:complete len:294 (-) Transcript_14954:10-891(-)
MEIDQPKNSFVNRAMREGLRLDHRSIQQYRPFSIKFGEKYGENVIVQLRKTSVSANVSYDLVEPSLSSPNSGFFDINISLLSKQVGSQGLFHRGPKMMHAVRFCLEQCIRSSGIVDVSSFVYVPGKTVGSLRVDLTILSDDGNTIDCCSVAAQAALRHFRCHEIAVSEQNEIIVHRDKDPIPFFRKPMALVVTLGYYENTTIVDPNALEMAFVDGFVNVCVSPSGQISGIYKFGGKPIGSDFLAECTSSGIVKALKLIQFIDEMLEKDSKEREECVLAKIQDMKRARESSYEN